MSKTTENKATDNAAAKIKTPPILAFARKLEPTDALMYSCNWGFGEQKTPIELREKTVIGTMSARQKVGEKNVNLAAGNIQLIDFATTDKDHDTLVVQFNLLALPGVGVPEACTSPEYASRLADFIKGYTENGGLMELARRYAANIANGRFLWRNRLVAEDVDVIVEKIEGDAIAESWSFAALKHDLRSLKYPAESESAINELAKVICDGFTGNLRSSIRVTAHARVGRGQEVFPSQEFVQGVQVKTGSKSKQLYSAWGIAALHSQKVGNALRTIDTWHGQAASVGAIAVEPYGGVVRAGQAYRATGDSDFYTLSDKRIGAGKEVTANEEHFIAAVLIRGGVFGEGKGKE